MSYIKQTIDLEKESELQNMKITAKDLSIIKSLANSEYVNSNAGVLDDKEMVAKCWLVAMNTHLKLGLELDFPKQTIPEPDDE